MLNISALFLNIKAKIKFEIGPANLIINNKKGSLTLSISALTPHIPNLIAWVCLVNFFATIK
ncbi:MAG: hypothetical protein RR664_01195 [Clostridia bacterium]